MTPSDDERDGRRAPSGWGHDDQATRAVPRPGSDGPGAGADDERPVAPRQYFVPAGVGAARPSESIDAPAGRESAAGRRAAPPVGPPGGRGPTAPSSTPGPEPRPRVRRRRRRWGPKRIIAAVLLALVVLVLLFVLFMLWQFNRIDRVDVGDALASGGSGTNYLIVGSDSREGFDPNAPNAGAVLGDGADGSGQRSDTMLILRTSGDGDLMTSVPRDLWVTRADGSEGRINAAYRDGPAALIASIEQGVGIPVHRYVEVDFVTFAGLVDAVGGVTIDFAHPARDLHSGLDVQQTGPVQLDGTQALAFVRARHYEEMIDGAWVGDPTGDLGRVQRQQTFLRAVMGEVGSSRNPITLMRMASAVSGGLRIDDRMSMWDALSFARAMGGLDPESIELPTYPWRTSGGAAVLGLVEPDARAVIARFQD